MTTLAPAISPDMRKLARRLKGVEQLVRDLGGSPQLSLSTIGDDETGEQLVVADVIGNAAVAVAAVPALQETAADQDTAWSAMADTFDAMDADMVSRFGLSDQQLADAAEQLAAADQQIRDAFGQSIDQISGDVQTAIVAAGGAQESAQHAADLATQASTAAATAQGAANDAAQAALDAAGLAASKGETIFQKTAPTGSRASAANLWIDITPDANGNPKNTPNRYDTDQAKWLPITDQKTIDAAAAAATAQQTAAAAGTAAQTAQQTAEAAKTAAGNAQTTADGRPLILFSANGPSGSAPTGSTWFQVNGAQAIVGQWQQTGTVASPVWTARPIASDVIANLDVGKLTAGNAAIADLVAQRIAASTANIQTVNVANLFVTNGAVMQQATIDYLFAKVVQAYKITASMIDVNTLNGVTITGATVQTAADGARAVLAGIGMSFYDNAGRFSGQVSSRLVGNSDLQRTVIVQAGPNSANISGYLLVETPVQLTSGETAKPKYDVEAGNGIYAPDIVGNSVWLKLGGSIQSARVLRVAQTATDAYSTYGALDFLTLGTGTISSASIGTVTSATKFLGLLTANMGVAFADGTQQSTAYVPPSDTLWITPTVTGANYSANTVRVRKQGNRVEWSGQLNRSANMAAASNIMNVPASMAPSMPGGQSSRLITATGPAGVLLRMEFYPNGTVGIRDISGGTATYAILDGITYSTD